MCRTTEEAKSWRDTGWGGGGGGTRRGVQKGSDPAHPPAEALLCCLPPLRSVGSHGGLLCSAPHCPSSVDIPPKRRLSDLFEQLPLTLEPTKPHSSVPGNSAVSLKIWGFHALACYFVRFEPRSHHTSTISPGPTARLAASTLISTGSSGHSPIRRASPLPQHSPPALAPQEAAARRTPWPARTSRAGSPPEAGSPLQGPLCHTPRSLQAPFYSSGKCRQNRRRPSPPTLPITPGWLLVALSSGEGMPGSSLHRILLADAGFSGGACGSLANLTARASASLQNGHSLWADFEWAA